MKSHSDIQLSIIVPVHNEASTIEQTVERLRTLKTLFGLQRVTIHLVENGSTDSSAGLVRRLQERYPDVTAAWGEPAGIGYAYAYGMQQALERGGMQPGWLMLTAADLPFGFSDLQSFLQAYDAAAGENETIYIGSKRHPASRVCRGMVRTLASVAYWMLRRVVLGMKTKDPQGVIFLPYSIAARLVPLVRSRDFSFTTELIFHAERQGVPVMELPVELGPGHRPSTVRLFRDGRRMLACVMRLWLRNVVRAASPRGEELVADDKRLLQLGADNDVAD